ncbi:MAG: NAD-dependent epimerase/dehydratase family protein, partial [Anaerolineales bacterium]
MTNDNAPARRMMLITGATGFIGSRLAARAMEQCYAVKTLTRSDWDGQPAVPLAQRYFGSLPGPIPVESFQGVEVVVHCAAEVENKPRSAEAVNVEGTRRLAELARQNGARTFIFLSSQSARPDALSAYGRTKHAAEQLLLNLDGLNVIILRPGLVTGPGSRGLFQRMSNMVRALPVVPLLAGGRSIVQPIHVDDLCNAILRCCERADGLNKAVLHLGDAQGVSLAEFLQTVATAQLGRRKLMLSIPLWPVKGAVRLAEALRIPLPINSNNLRGLKVVEKMETRTDMERLGIAPRPLKQAVRAEAADPKTGTLSLQERPARVLLVGAGRVGLVHAVTLSRLRGVRLAGLVDRKKGATALLKG